MAGFRERYLSFDGRLARLPFFVRCIYVNIAAMLILGASVPLFSNGDRAVWWWAGVAGVIASLVVLIGGIAPLMVRRLHDLGLSGYHVIWVGAAEAFSTLRPGDTSTKGMLIALPLLAIGLWLTFWPGKAVANRFGSPPE